MVKKVFALASVTALSGLMISMVAAGCSSTTTIDPVDSSTDNFVPKNDSGRPDTAVDEDTGTPTCPSTDPIDTSDEVFKTPTPAVVGACTEADLKAMEDVVAKGNIQALADLGANVSATCKACAFTANGDTAATWGPIVSNVTIGGTATDIFNTGACLAIVSGNEACGKAYAAFNDCNDFACKDCASSAVQACQTKAAQGACDPQRAAVVSTCGANITTYLNQCQAASEKGCTICGGPDSDIQYQFEAYVVQQCVHNPLTADAGDGG